MKRATILVLVLFVAFAQGAWAEEVEASEANMGNYLTFQAGMLYNILGNPYTQVALGYDFSLNPEFVVSANLGMINQQNIDEEFDDEDATGGKSTFAFGGIKFKALFGSFFLSNGYTYQTLINGYYITGDDDDYESLSRSDVPDALGVSLGVGYYSRVGDNLLLIPELSMNYNLPTSDGYEFDVSDLALGISLGLGLDMRAAANTQ